MIDRSAVPTLEDKTVVVTGASSGIGAAIAEEMAAAGGRVLLVGRDEERLAGVLERIEADGGTAVTCAVDLRATDAADLIVRSALKAYGGLDVLVHSAGIFEPCSFEDTTTESLDVQWEVNVRVPFLLTQAALPHLRDGGVVLMISSIAGHVGFVRSAAYCATKGAIELMTKALASELAAEGVRVNAIAPGNIHTAINAHLLADPDYEAAMIAATPAGRVGTVEDIAPVAVFLASDAAAYVHGASLLVDGGWTAH